MPSRRQIREAVVQFLYCADLEGGADPAGLRDPFWDFVTESDRRSLQLATFRTVHHLAQIREGRIAEFVERQQAAKILISLTPSAENLGRNLEMISELEAYWSRTLLRLERFPIEGDDCHIQESFKKELNKLFGLDRQLWSARSRFIQDVADFPKLVGPLEPIVASIRRLQRISDRLQMIEEPEKFPEQQNLARLRQSKAEILELRKISDELVDGILSKKNEIDGRLGKVVENFVPERIDPVDRAILRLAIYEIYFTTTPKKVILNEAIELAKRFGTTDSSRFVNGVLDKASSERSD